MNAPTLGPLPGRSPRPHDNTRPIEDTDTVVPGGSGVEKGGSDGSNHVCGHPSIYDKKIATFSQSVRAAAESRMDTFTVFNSLEELGSPQLPGPESSNRTFSFPGASSVIIPPGSTRSVSKPSRQEYCEQLTTVSHGSSVVDDSMNRPPSGSSVTNSANDTGRKSLADEMSLPLLSAFKDIAYKQGRIRIRLPPTQTRLCTSSTASTDFANPKSSAANSTLTSTLTTSESSDCIGSKQIVDNDNTSKYKRPNSTSNSMQSKVEQGQPAIYDPQLHAPLDSPSTGSLRGHGEMEGILDTTDAVDLPLNDSCRMPKDIGLETKNINNTGEMDGDLSNPFATDCQLLIRGGFGVATEPSVSPTTMIAQATEETAPMPNPQSSDSVSDNGNALSLSSALDDRVSYNSRSLSFPGGAPVSSEPKTSGGAPDALVSTECLVHDKDEDSKVAAKPFIAVHRPSPQSPRRPLDLPCSSLQTPKPDKSARRTTDSSKPSSFQPPKSRFSTCNSPSLRPTSAIVAPDSTRSLSDSDETSRVDYPERDDDQIDKSLSHHSDASTRSFDDEVNGSNEAEVKMPVNDALPIIGSESAENLEVGQNLPDLLLSDGVDVDKLAMAMSRSTLRDREDVAGFNFSNMSKHESRSNGSESFVGNRYPPHGDMVEEFGDLSRFLPETMEEDIEESRRFSVRKRMQAMTCLELDNQLRFMIERPLTTAQVKEYTGGTLGYVYILENLVPLNNGYWKIGTTNGLPADRATTRSRDCKVSMKHHYHSAAVPVAKRAEDLFQIHLRHFSVSYPCRSSQTSVCKFPVRDGEFFKLNYFTAKLYVDLWSAFLHHRPYDETGNLHLFWQDELRKVPKPAKNEHGNHAEQLRRWDRFVRSGKKQKWVLEKSRAEAARVQKVMDEAIAQRMSESTKQLQALVDEKVAQRLSEKMKQLQALVDAFGADFS